MLETDDVGTAADRGHRDTQLRGPADDFGRGVLGRPGVDQVVPFLPALLATLEPGQLLVAEEIGTFDEHEEIVELLAAVGTETDEAVEGRLDRRGLEGALGRGQGRLPPSA